MKFLGYVVAFLFASVLVTIASLFIIFGVVAAVSFITWSSLPFFAVEWWIVTRITMCLGAFVGILFITSPEGKEAASDFVDSVKKGFKSED